MLNPVRPLSLEELRSVWLLLGPSGSGAPLSRCDDAGKAPGVAVEPSVATMPDQMSTFGVSLSGEPLGRSNAKPERITDGEECGVRPTRRIGPLTHKVRSVSRGRGRQ